MAVDTRSLSKLVAVFLSYWEHRHKVARLLADGGWCWFGVAITNLDAPKSQLLAAEQHAVVPSYQVHRTPRSEQVMEVGGTVHNLRVVYLRVPKTSATWAKALQSAVERSACGGTVLARPECGMIFGLWA
jgi:hypothetical protein